MAPKNQFNTSIKGHHATVLNAETIHYRASGRCRPRMAYPAGSIGADLPRRNYIRYLVERYNHFKHADSSFGSHLKTLNRFSYAVIFKNIEAKFRAPTYFIPVEQFDELVEYLQGRIDQTILGKRNLARGHGNYVSFDEYCLMEKTTSA